MEVALDPQPYARVGKVEQSIPVGVSFRLTELFSGMLYPGPPKAVEELVGDSRDAMAKRVDVDLVRALELSVSDGSGSQLPTRRPPR